MKNATYTSAQILSADFFQIQMSMANLLKYGSWEFRTEYDNNEIYDYETEEYTTPDPEQYESWVEQCDVRITFHSGSSSYEIHEWNGNGYTIWGAQSTGDDAQSAIDVAQALQDGVAELLNADFE